jgi:methylated-DNA-protein-cysteine methyltransferase-like protein
MPAEQKSFHDRVVAAIKAVPKGKVATYGQIAALAGSPRAARQVVRILYSSSRKEELPWHRVINSRGRIALKPGQGYEEQRARLAAEGIRFGEDDGIDLAAFLWTP